jgi:hypothetical protein
VYVNDKQAVVVWEDDEYKINSKNGSKNDSRATSLVIEVADDSMDVEEIVELVNASYRIGEYGIFIDTNETSFVRISSNDVQQMIMDDAVTFLLLYSRQDCEKNNQNSISPVTTKKKLLGCIKIEKKVYIKKEQSNVESVEIIDSIDYDCEERNTSYKATTNDILSHDDEVFELGCFAVDVARQGERLGHLLFQQAELYVQDILMGHILQVQLVSPTHWKHSHKERLRQWYTERLKYHLSVPNDYKQSTIQLPAQYQLMPNAIFQVDVDITSYIKIVKHS